MCGGSLSIRIGFIFNFDVNFVAVTREWSNDSVILVLVEGVDVTELAEYKVRRACEIEGLGGELILAFVRNSHCDIVVSLKTTDSSPEEKLLKVSVTSPVEQSL